MKRAPLLQVRANAKRVQLQALSRRMLRQLGATMRQGDQMVAPCLLIRGPRTLEISCKEKDGTTSTRHPANSLAETTSTMGATDGKHVAKLGHCICVTCMANETCAIRSLAQPQRNTRARCSHCTSSALIDSFQGRRGSSSFAVKFARAYASPDPRFRCSICQLRPAPFNCGEAATEPETH